MFFVYKTEFSFIFSYIKYALRMLALHMRRNLDYFYIVAMIPQMGGQNIITFLGSVVLRSLVLPCHDRCLLIICILSPRFNLLLHVAYRPSIVLSVLFCLGLR